MGRPYVLVAIVFGEFEWDNVLNLPAFALGDLLPADVANAAVQLEQAQAFRWWSVATLSHHEILAKVIERNMATVLRNTPDRLPDAPAVAATINAPAPPT
ncbi:MAG: hypothetical protein AAF468_06385 [Pseudomonadota bacterium]